MRLSLTQGINISNNTFVDDQGRTVFTTNTPWKASPRTTTILRGDGSTFGPPISWSAADFLKRRRGSSEPDVSEEGSPQSVGQPRVERCAQAHITAGELEYSRLQTESSTNSRVQA